MGLRADASVTSGPDAFPMSQDHHALPEPRDLGPDPEPLGTARYERLIGRLERRAVVHHIVTASQPHDEPSTTLAA